MTSLVRTYVQGVEMKMDGIKALFGWAPPVLAPIVASEIGFTSSGSDCFSKMFGKRALSTTSFYSLVNRYMWGHNRLEEPKKLRFCGSVLHSQLPPLFKEKPFKKHLVWLKIRRSR